MAQNTLEFIGLAVLMLALGYYARLTIGKRRRASLEHKTEERLEAAKVEAKKIVLEAQEKAAALLTEVQQEERERKQETRRLEERLIKKEDSLERRLAESEKETERLAGEETRIKDLETETTAVREKAVRELEKISGLSKEEAKIKIFEELQTMHRQELAGEMARLEKDKRDEIEKKSLEIITTAIQRYARSSVADVTTTAFHLPDEDIKGKIIGREGRNIRAFERLTGVEVVIDETPQSLILSSFDPMRREVAKLALEKLIKDGRIQPAKIEEKVEEARLELETRIQKIGEEAAYEVGILDLPKEIIYLLGRLNYRTSYGQNVLLHSIEMAHIAGMMASELGLKVDIAKKGALVHDIGKAIDHEVEGTHVDLGRKLLKKYGVNEEVIRAMESHHEEYPFSTPESFVVTAADAISAARPGARRDTLEKYLRRLEDIEKAVMTFEGVKQTYAVSAGREVRVFVVPEKIDDFGALKLAKEIARKIHEDVNYPGEIKVTVIREVKAVEYAR